MDATHLGWTAARVKGLADAIADVQFGIVLVCYYSQELEMPPAVSAVVQKLPSQRGSEGGIRDGAPKLPPRVNAPPERVPLYDCEEFRRRINETRAMIRRRATDARSLSPKVGEIYLLEAEGVSRSELVTVSRTMMEIVACIDLMAPITHADRERLLWLSQVQLRLREIAGRMPSAEPAPDSPEGTTDQHRGLLTTKEVCEQFHAERRYLAKLNGVGTLRPVAKKGSGPTAANLYDPDDCAKVLNPRAVPKSGQDGPAT